MKKFGIRILCMVLTFAMLILQPFAVSLSASAVETGKKDPVLKTRDDFAWGLNMHNNFYAVYGTVNLEEQIHLAAEMGCTILRNNFNESDLGYNDMFVQLCNAYGIQVMLTCTGHVTGDSFYDHDLFKMIANRYNGKNGHGKIDYIQIDNELDLYFANLLGSYGGSLGNGASISQYPAADLERVCKNVKKACAAVREADSDVRIVINAGWEHYGMFLYFVNQGVDFDVIGWDWYGDQAVAYLSQGKTAFGIYDTLDSLFHKPIMICETNIWNSDPNVDENDPATWDRLVEICEDAYSKPNVIGCIFYQMCDQLNFEKDGTYDREAHFGFIYADKFGNMTGKKAAYDRFKHICGGVTMPKITIDSLMKKNDNDPTNKPTDKKENNTANKDKKQPVMPIQPDDTPSNDSGLTDPNDSPTDGESDPVNSDPVRIVHKGKVSNEFVWTTENTLTVIVVAVTLIFFGVSTVLFLKMRKKMRTISQLKGEIGSEA